jgi:hypothetical protein
VLLLKKMSLFWQTLETSDSTLPDLSCSQLNKHHTKTKKLTHSKLRLRLPT